MFLRAHLLIKFTIILNIFSNRPIRPIDKIPADNITPSQCGPGSNGNKGVTLHSSEFAELEPHYQIKLSVWFGLMAY